MQTNILQMKMFFLGRNFLYETSRIVIYGFHVFRKLFVELHELVVVVSVYLNRRRSELFPLWRHVAVEGTLVYDETQYVVDRLDEISRILFPTSFILVNLVYWTFYLYLAED